MRISKEEGGEKEHFILEISQLKTTQKKQQHLHLTSRIPQLETSLKEETARATKAERCLAQQNQETARIHAALVTLG